MTINGREVKETGVYQPEKTMYKSGRALLFFSIAALVLFLLLYLVIITSGTLDAGGKTVYAAKSFYVLMTAIPVLLSVVIILLVAVSNIYYAKKSKVKDMSSGTREEAIVSEMDPSGLKYVVFIASDRKCSACGVKLMPGNAKFCPECGTKQI